MNTGRLTPVQREPVRGSISRNIAFVRSGRWALVAGQESNTLALFEVDTATGMLSYTRQIKAAPTPMAIVIEPAN
jgi:6-phosphogluconolactonase